MNEIEGKEAMLDINIDESVDLWNSNLYSPKITLFKATTQNMIKTCIGFAQECAKCCTGVVQVALHSMNALSYFVVYE